MTWLFITCMHRDTNASWPEKKATREAVEALVSLPRSSRVHTRYEQPGMPGLIRTCVHTTSQVPQRAAACASNLSLYTKDYSVVYDSGLVLE